MPSSAPREMRHQRERRIAANQAAAEAAATRSSMPPPAHRPLRLMHRTTVTTDSSESDDATPVARNPMNMPRHGYPWETISNLTELRRLYPVEWEHTLSEMVNATDPSTERHSHLAAIATSPDPQGTVEQIVAERDLRADALDLDQRIMAIRAMAITPVLSTDQDAQPWTPAVNTRTLTDT